MRASIIGHLFPWSCTKGVALPPRQSRRDRTTSKMRTTPTTRENARSDGIISPSTQVVDGLIIPLFKAIRITRTIDIHDLAEVNLNGSLQSSLR
jgi:hypothetical protein